MKILNCLNIVALAVFFTCSSDDDNSVDINNAPNNFTVKALSAEAGLEIVLSWTAAIDPEQDDVLYDVYVEGEKEVENTSTLSTTFLAKTYSTEISGKVTAKDGNGNTTDSNFTITSSGFVKIPDLNFEKRLISRRIDNG